MAVFDTHRNDGFAKDNEPLQLERAVEKKNESDYDGESRAKSRFIGILSTG